MKHSVYEYGILTNGLRFVCSARKSAAEYCGVIINVGSRDEIPEQEGIAHFIEHTIFKGTERRSSRHIINRMEGIGGELNAYTTKEETAIYSVFPKGGLSRAVDLIADIVINSRFPQSELDKEREVVLDELESYLDTPSEAVFDSFDELFFKDNPLAHNILGTRETVSRFNSEECRKFLSEFYTSSNMIFFYSGNMRMAQVKSMLEKYFTGLPSGKAPVIRSKPLSPYPFSDSVSLDNHQAHTVIGAMTDGIYSPSRYELALLINMLGGPGMNSLLNLALREKRGLVYMVDAGSSSYTDCGLFTVYFGCDHNDTARCADLVRGEISRLALEPLSQRRLAAAKRQYLGQLIISHENGEQAALSMGRAFLYRGSVASFDEIKLNIENITAESLMQTAKTIAAENLSQLTLE